MVDLKGKDFLKVLDFSKEEIRYLIDLAKDFKNKKRNNESHEYLKGKNIAIIFEKDSTRTRCSFEVAAYDLGMHVTYLGPTGSQMGKKETIADTARVLCSMYDGIEYRGFAHEIVETLAKYSSSPVWNGLTDDFHPTQMLADFMTMEEEFGHLEGLKLVFFGDGRNNVANSLMAMSALCGVNFTCCAPKDLQPDEELVEKCRSIAKENNCEIVFETDVLKASENADAIYTDVWVSMGEAPEKWKERIEYLKPYEVNQKIIDNAKENVIFLHCLPSFHNIDTTIGKEIYEKYGLESMEVTDEVFEGSHSRVFEEAENRMHTIKAVMYATLKK